MSKYTTELRYICEAYSGVTESQGYKGIAEVISKSIPHIFDFDFPIYDESYRNVLCTKILKHYYTREIGAESYGLWKHWLDTRLNEIMPYYNQLYKSAVIEFDPMYDTDLTTTQKRESSEEGENNGSANHVSRELYSDTPQGALTHVEDETYLTNATKNMSEGDSEGAYKNSSTEDYIQTIKGKTGGASFSKRLVEFRETFINIDRMIIDELSDLFMGLW